MIGRGKCGSVATGRPDSSRGMRRRVSRIGLGLDKFFQISGRNEESDQGFGTRRDPLGIPAFKHWITWAIIAGGLTCVGCSSVAWF